MKRTTILIGISILCLLLLLLAGLIDKRRWGLEGRFYENTSMAGEPAVIRKHTTPHLSNEQGAELLGVPTFSVVWKGWIAISQSGTYRFATNSDDGSKLRINGQIVVDNGGMHGMAKVSGDIALEQGFHEIEIRYVQYGGFSVMQTFWTPPNKKEALLPSHLLFVEQPGKLAVMGRNALRIAFLFAQYVGSVLLLIAAGWSVFRRIPREQRLIAVGLFAGGILIFCVTYFSFIKHTGSDPLGSLLTSQAILQHGTIRLDVYQQQEQLQGYTYRVYEKDGHFYYYYPPGTPIFALPAVWIANLLGYDMIYRDQEAKMQLLLAALLSTLAFALLYRLCRCYLSPSRSLWAAALLFLSSSFVIGLGSALWIMDFPVIFHLISLEILAADAKKKRPLNIYWLGFFLFASYLCRPTASLFIVVVFGYVLLVKRSQFLRLTLFCAALFGLFVAWSWSEYHQLLPRYYLPEHQLNLGRPDMWLGLYGTLFSPGRGVFVYNPLLALSVLGAMLYIKSLYKHPLFWLSVAWFTLHTLTISRFPVWHGGGSYGSRLFTDVLPALVLLTLLAWNAAAAKQDASRWRLAGSGLCLLAALWGVFINTYQGLYNWATVDWNADPHIEQYPEIVLDWTYPQFLATPQRLTMRSYDYQKRRLNEYDVGEKLTADRNKAIFVNWFPPEQTAKDTWRRWSNGYVAQMLFVLDPFDPGTATQASLALTLSAFGEQTVEIRLNHQPLGTVHFDAGESKNVTLPFPLERLRPQSSDNKTLDVEFPPGQVHSLPSSNGFISLEFLISNPVLRTSAPRGRWEREIGIRFESLDITLDS